MNAAQLERRHEQMAKLRLTKSTERLEALLQEAVDKELAYADFLDQLFTEELAAKTSKNIAMRTNLARFPFVKTLETFDFSYQPSLDKQQVHNLATCHFVEHGENVVILGPPRAWAKPTCPSASASRPSSAATGYCSPPPPT